MREQDTSLYLQQTEPQKSCLLALRSLILAYNTSITETRKYGMPCFCYNGKPLCYLWIDKKTTHPYILFVEGNKLSHPALEQGKRARMKILSIHPEHDIPLHTLQGILGMAVSLYNA